MRSVNHALSLGLLLTGPAASCNDARLDGDYQVDGGHGPRPHDLAGVDLRRPRNPDAACASVKASATLDKKPVDIVFIVDNSGSMTDKIEAVQRNINMNFADIIGKSGLDYRVILVSNHGDYKTQQAVCITAPLSGNPSCSPVPPKPVNTARFYHYAIQIESTDSFRRLLGSFDGTIKDRFNFSPTGWSAWLREDAYKVFIEITDDNSDMSDTAFDTQLLAKSPKHFGNIAKRNYVFHSIIGLHENNPPSKPWGPMDPFQTDMCTRNNAAENNSPIYQKLSMTTGGLRFPICEYSSFDAVFTSVAMGVIAGAKVACDFATPMPPAGEQIDPSSVVLEYTPMGTGGPQLFKQVKGPADCDAHSFYLQSDRIYICPDACSAIQGDSKAKVEVDFDCLDIIG